MTGLICEIRGLSFLLHFSGPSSFEQTVALKPGSPTVVVGRDPGAAVFLPDEERMVSRRHLSIEWSDGGVLVRVLSPNGISTDHGDYFAGDEVLLADGESARICSFSLLVSEAPAGIDATSFAGMGRRMPSGPVTRTFLEKEPEQDPWAKLATPRAPAPTDPRRPAPARAENAALQKLCRGLGIEMPRDANFDWERFGGSVRQVVQCLGDHLTARADTRREMRAEEPTMIGAKESNPLKSGLRTREMLQYLFFAPQGVAGWTPAPQALREMSEEARSHEAAVRTAARGLAEGAIREFDPAKLRGTLLQGKLSLTPLVDNARLWDLYAGDYENRSHDLADWGEQLFNRYYMAGYLREVERLRRARMPAPPQRTR